MGGWGGALPWSVTQRALAAFYQQRLAAVQSEIGEISEAGVCSSMKKAYSLVNTAKAKNQEAVQSVYLKVSVILGVVGGFLLQKE